MLDIQQIQSEFDRMFSHQSQEKINSYYGPIQDDTIATAENLIQLTFPLSYRLFLRRFGVANFGSYDIHGLIYADGEDEFSFQDVAERTYQLRNTIDYNFVEEDKIISISNDQDGVRFYLDLNYYKDGEAPVVAISGYFGPTVVAKNFLEFLQVVVKSLEVDNPFNMY